MMKKRRYLPIAAIAAVALVAAACSSNDDDATTTEMMPEEMEPAGPTVAEITAGLFARAHDARTAADDAAEAAVEAVTDATEAAGGLTTEEVSGDSSVAMMNAEAIVGEMGAQQIATDAATAAETAQEDAEDALVMAMEHAADNASLIAALEEAIEVAKAQVKAATDARDSDALKAAVDAVTDGEDADTPRTPLSIANSVGMNIAMALLPDAAGGEMRVMHGAMAPADTDNVADELKFEDDDRVGMKWTQIAETTKMRIATPGTTTSEVDAASIAGMTLATERVATNAEDMTAEDMMEDDGLQVDATYKGIVGMAFCVGSDCVVEAVEEDDAVKKFAGSWYFTPTDGDEHYVKNADGTAYMPETLFASYGHWLTSAVDDDANATQWTVHTFATSEVATASYSLAAADDENKFGDGDTATYSGPAAGMSVHKTDNAAGDGQDIASGRFTADVTLTAMFGASPMIGGTIDGFIGSAVNENWTVKLEDATLADGGDEPTTGMTVTTGRDGTWSNAAYGAANARPTGVFGGFTAHFSDGHAAGAYATR